MVRVHYYIYIGSEVDQLIYVEIKIKGPDILPQAHPPSRTYYLNDGHSSLRTALHLS